eukprot:UN23997
MLSKFTRVSPISFKGLRYFSRWANVEMGPKDPILGVSEAWKADPSPDKINLGVGAYRDDQGKPYVLNCVREAEKRVMEKKMDHEYAPIVGRDRFVQLSKELAYGSDCDSKYNIVGLQALSGTGSLRLLAGFLKSFPCKDDLTVYMSNPTWGNHHTIFQHAGLKTSTYSYYDPKTIGLDYEGMKKDIEAAADGSAFILHASAHNPTGIDPTSSQWAELSKLMKRKIILYVLIWRTKVSPVEIVIKMWTVYEHS